MSVAETFDPRVINAPEGEPDWTKWLHEHSEEVRKIVIGPSPGSDGDAVTLEELPLARFEGLTHLYLWSVEGLERLPELPGGLRCLDVRRCTDLTELPPLPASLETLDLGHCKNLRELPADPPGGLRRLYVDGCIALEGDELGMFLKKLGDAPLEELDASGTTALTSIRRVPHRVLRKLVLRDCPDLQTVEGIEDFAVLDHLDLADCTLLEELPGLPPSLRFLSLHGAERLCRFMGQDIGPYDRGTRPGDDVAKLFRIREKFGNELAVMPHAKLLFLGDGGVGKTTLAKRFQWEELTPEEREAPEGRDLQPRKDEPHTERVRFAAWHTRLEVPEESRAALDVAMRSGRVAVDVNLDEAGLDGTIRLWDFGGQELYHGTHRIFAGEGSIFLIVWCETPPEPRKRPDDVLPAEWDEWHRHRPLDYWLDYVFSVRPDATVALACTRVENPDERAHAPNWRATASRHRERDLPSFAIDTLDAGCGDHAQYCRLVEWVREACGSEARDIGLMQPRFFRDVSNLVIQWQEENSRSRARNEPARHLLRPWGEWARSVRALHESSGSAVTLSESDIEAITEYLHESGHLFRISQGSARAVLVDQQWAADLVYRLLETRYDGLRAAVRRRRGWFHRSDLEADPVWASLEDDAQRERLLAYMEQCRIVTRIASARHHREGRDVYLAGDKWLLPEQEDPGVQDELKRFVEEVQRHEVTIREDFDFETLELSELDFRTLQSVLAGTFGTDAVYFRNGLQAHEPGALPSWVFRLTWVPDDESSYLGRLAARLVAHRERVDAVAEQLERLLRADGSPLAGRLPTRRKHGDHRDVERPSLAHREFDVAISSRSADEEAARSLAESLMAAGLSTDWYRLDPDVDADGRERQMDRMKECPCMVLLVSDAYLENDPERNWYCAWELADAVLQLGSGERSRDRTIVLFKTEDRFTFDQFDERAEALIESCARHFHDAYREKDALETLRWDHYTKRARKFVRALESESWDDFMRERGERGHAIGLDDLPLREDGTRDFSKVVEMVADALGKTLRQ